MAAEKKAHIGVTGLAVMGANLARNFARNGYTVALHNRSRARTDALVAEHGHEGDFVATETLEELVQSLAAPRRVLIMVKAGKPVDDVIEQLVPLLETGDIVIDAGNSPLPSCVLTNDDLLPVDAVRLNDGPPAVSDTPLSTGDDYVSDSDSENDHFYS